MYDINVSIKSPTPVDPNDLKLLVTMLVEKLRALTPDKKQVLVANLRSILGE